MPPTAFELQKEEYSDVQLLLAWVAPERPFRHKSREFFLTALLIAFLIEVILFLFSEYQLMLAVASLVFLSFVLVSVPPKDSQYALSSEGIKIQDHFFIWGELYDFYFKKIDKIETLIVRTKLLFPPELTIPLGSHSAEEVRKILLPFLPYREVVAPTFMEKSADWLSHNFPLESAKHSKKPS